MIYNKKEKSEEKMKYTIPVSKDMAYASTTLSISTKHAIKVSRAINRKKFSDAKKKLEDILAEKDSINGKFYTKTAKEILKILNGVESNAKAKNLNPEEMEVYISAHKGATLYRSRRRRKHGIRLKSSHVQIILKGEKHGSGKDVHKGSN